MCVKLVGPRVGHSGPQGLGLGSTEDGLKVVDVWRAGNVCQVPNADVIRCPKGYEYSNNQVFDKSELLPLLCEAQELLAAGKAVVVSRTYTTLENKFWGIDAGHHVNVVFVWTELSTDWVNELPAETQQSLANGDFDSPSNIVGDWPFPFLLSLNGAPDGQDFTALSPGQANLYASLTEWTLRQSEAGSKQKPQG
eukprot:Skav204219  [mRNA]  locus=scaffold1550:17139:17723:- [translate_table: standard]